MPQWIIWDSFSGILEPVFLISLEVKWKIKSIETWAISSEEEGTSQTLPWNHSSARLSMDKHWPGEVLERIVAKVSKQALKSS